MLSEFAKDVVPSTIEAKSNSLYAQVYVHITGPVLARFNLVEP